MIKTIVVSIITSLVVVGLALVGLVGNQSVDKTGSANTRFPNGINVTAAPSSATSSLTLGKVCITFTSTSGTTYYGYYKDAGALATSTTACQ